VTGVAEEAAVARIAAAQQGMVSFEQLVAAGFRPNAIGRRVAGGWLTRRHAGVYQLGVHGGRFGDEMAALLACGREAILGGWASVALFELAERGGRPVDILVPRHFEGHPVGVRRHVTAWLAPGDVVVRHGMPVTVPARTLLDLAATTPRRELERLVEEAQVRRLVSHGELLAMVERGAGRRGVRKLRAIVSLLDEPLLTRSEAERRLLALVRSANLPLPRTNVRIAGLEVDAVWPEHRLVVEVDGYAFHGTRAAFERDRRRDARLLMAGYRVIRLTWRQLTREPAGVTQLLATALRAETQIVSRERERSGSRVMR
jgi:very-short-patch-repair endonuclease